MSMFPATAQGASAVLFGLAGLVGTSIVSYGAVGDGVSDDTAAILSAATAVSGAEGGVVLIPEGSFYCQYVYLLEGVEYRGTSRKKSILKRKYLGINANPPGGIYQGDHWPGDVSPDGALMYAFIAADPSGGSAVNKAGVCNLTIDGNGGSFSEMNLEVNPDFSYDNINDLNCIGLRIKDVDSINAPSDLDLSQTNSYARSACARIVASGTDIDGSYFYGAAYNCLSVDGVAATDFRITNNTIGSGRRAGLQVEYGGNNYVIAHNRVFNDWIGTPAGTGFGSISGSVPATLVNAAYNHTTGSLTLTNAFEKYVWASGHKVYITGGTGFARGYYSITSRTSSNAIVISGGPTADASNVGGYLANSGCGVINAGASHALYFHGSPKGCITGNHCYNNSYIGGAAIAFFGDLDGSSDDRPFQLASITGNYFESVNGPCLLATSTHLHSLSFVGNTFAKLNGSGVVISWSTNDYTTPTNGIKFIGNNIEQQTGNDVATFGGITGLMFSNNTVNKPVSGNNGINFTRCSKLSVVGNTFLGPGGGAVAMLLTPNAGVQCDEITIDNNYFSGWIIFAECNSASVPIDSAVVTNNRFGTMTQNLQSFVTGKTGTWVGQDTPSRLVVYGNTGANAVDHASGTATITAAATSVTVSHGLASGTPGRWRKYTSKDITITPTLMSLSKSWWITAVTDTQFTINVDVVPGAGTATFDWSMDLRQS